MSIKKLLSKYQMKGKMKEENLQFIEKKIKEVFQRA